VEQNILIVEDQVNLSAALTAILEQKGYQVDAVYDGQTGLEYATAGNYDAVVLDIMLPKLDGLAVIAELRRAGNDVPVIMLTARDSLRDKVSGLDAGADDYLTKPFQPAELLARLRALTRRQGTVVAQALKLGNTTLDLESGDLSVSAADDNNAGGQSGSASEGGQVGDAGAVGAVGASSIHLSRREFELCQMLMANPGQTISKAQLLRRVWGSDSEADENSVEAYVSFVRKKLAFLHSNISITTLRLVGYRMTVAEASADASADALSGSANGDDDLGGSDA
jgi:DNA-binding response OmpR family regulator